MERGSGVDAWFTKAQAAKVLNVSKRTLERFIAARWLPVVRLRGVVRVTEKDLREFQERAEAGAFA